jgi:hypothetical protein
VLHFLSHFLQVQPHKVQVWCSFTDDFLILFADQSVVNRVLHVMPPQEATFSLVFRWWRLQAGALFSPLCFKVLLSITNLPAHI